MVNIKTFDLNLLRVLAALLEEISVSRAAKAVGLTQPATSNALARLRIALNDPLLVRHGRTMQLTPLAQSLLPRIRSLLNDIQDTLSDQTEFDPATSTRRFRLMVNDYAIATVVTDLITAREAHGWSIGFELLPFEDRFTQRLIDEDYDLAIRDDWALRDWRHRESLSEDYLVGLARRDHPRIGEAPSLEAFVAERHVLISPVGQSLGMVDAWLNGQGLKREIAVYLPHFLAVPGIIASSDLIISLPERIVAQAVASHGLRRFALPLPRCDFQIAMGWSARKARDPGLLWLKDQLRAACRVVRQEPGQAHGKH